MDGPPVVGLTAWRAVFPTYAGDQTLQTVEETYVEGIIDAGMIPMLIPNRQQPEAAADVVSVVDGLVITGGDDIDPATYGRERVRAENADRGVDRFEVALVSEARRQMKPVLAICRGLQLLNVALGGTLSQDITASGSPHELIGADDDPADLEMRRHTVLLAEDGFLAELFATTEIKVNTLHHQGIDELARDLIVEGRAPDGLVEAARCRGRWWSVGVQWHPERLDRNDRYPLFHALRQAIDSV